MENIGIVVDAVENLQEENVLSRPHDTGNSLFNLITNCCTSTHCESDEVAVLAGVEVSFALKREIDTC